MMNSTMNVSKTLSLPRYLKQTLTCAMTRFSLMSFTAVQCQYQTHARFALKGIVSTRTLLLNLVKFAESPLPLKRDLQTVKKASSRVFNQSVAPYYLILSRLCQALLKHKNHPQAQLILSKLCQVPQIWLKHKKPPQAPQKTVYLRIPPL